MRKKLKACDVGATAVEYALMLALVTGVIVAAVTAFGLSVKGLFDTLPPF